MSTKDGMSNPDRTATKIISATSLAICSLVSIVVLACMTGIIAMPIYISKSWQDDWSNRVQLTIAMSIAIGVLLILFIVLGVMTLITCLCGSISGVTYLIKNNKCCCCK